jgi:hypothetical protein
VNQKKASVDDLFEPLGTYDFSAGATATVTVSNEGTDGYVILDGVQWIPAE